MAHVAIFLCHRYIEIVFWRGFFICFFSLVSSIICSRGVYGALGKKIKNLKYELYNIYISMYFFKNLINKAVREQTDFNTARPSYSLQTNPNLFLSWVRLGCYRGVYWQPYIRLWLLGSVSIATSLSKK